MAATTMTIPALTLVSGSTAVAAGERVEVQFPQALGVEAAPAEFLAKIDSSQERTARLFFTLTTGAKKVAADTFDLEYFDARTGTWKSVALESGGAGRLVGATPAAPLRAGNQQMRFRLAVHEVTDPTQYKSFMVGGLTVRTELRGADDSVGAPLAQDTDKVAFAEPQLSLTGLPSRIPTDGAPTEFAVRLKNPTGSWYGPVGLSVRVQQAGDLVENARLEWYNPKLALWQKALPKGEDFEILGATDDFMLPGGYDGTQKLRLTLPSSAAVPGTGEVVAVLYDLGSGGRVLAATGKSVQIVPGAKTGDDDVQLVYDDGRQRADQPAEIEIDNTPTLSPADLAEASSREPSSLDAQRVAGFSGLMLALAGGALALAGRRRRAARC
ncbi:hypothetical protein C3Y87_19960 [Carbonactinospora thermoautotrophica]|uniref:Uncharacterized protein n=2 Tax=Carbonactinospora thermoautotrophica TaxID=1469144 RepID=A0A132ML50_9ACTN|nr:hypothetical protein TH66_20200 [Carbonactinospora thermoautotrophica]KWW98513.1 hypothetical protein LI90_135 [Carbonactinospora thermoautotrophica]MCX9193616.1 hypothetical protein [Carbonactinospora thermoautotrophica]